MKKTICSFLFVLPVLLLITTSAPAEEMRGGIGLTLAQLYHPTDEDHRGYFVVLHTFPGCPAEQAGIQKGDIIVMINGVQTNGKDLDDVLESQLRGDTGTDLSLVVWRSSSNSKLMFELTRDAILY